MKKFTSEDFQKMKAGEMDIPKGYELVDTVFGLQLIDDPHYVKEEIQGSLVFRRVNESNLEAEQLVTPEALYGPYWTEGEICCLFADSNVGKSILAVQIAKEISSRGTPVAYFDFELSAKQFQMRYCREDGGTFQFPDNLYRVDKRPEAYCDERALTRSAEDTIIDDIEAGCVRRGIRHIIIDNINTLTAKGQDGEAAIKLMQRLVALKLKHGLSMLVVAHTPKRDLQAEITDNDLAGSKNLFNIFDAVFAMGKVATDPRCRYLKQLKVRSSELTNDATHVEVLEINKEESGFLGFTHVKYDCEFSLIKRPKEEEQAERIEKVKELAAQGLSYRKIADQVGYKTPSAVSKILNGK